MVVRINKSTEQSDSQRDSSAALSPFHLFEDFFNNWALRTALERKREAYRPPVDVLEKDNKLIIRLEIPGLEEKDVNVTLEGRTLTIHGERKPERESEGYRYHQVEGFYGRFSRSFDLQNSFDADKISANFNSGVLTVTVPQKQEVQARPIKVTTG